MFAFIIHVLLTFRFSIGEILSTIKPVIPANVDRRLGPPLDFSFSEAQKMSGKHLFNLNSR